MNNKQPRIDYHAALVFCTALLLSVNPVTAQTTTAPAPVESTANSEFKPESSAPKRGEDAETFVLSPFVVKGEQDTGYQATDTLAGTRLRTPLKDIAASISVVTKQLMEDTGSTNLTDILVYTTGTEVSGIGGNFAGNTNAGLINTNYEAARNDPIPQTRVRGLAAADTTRNYFGTLIPLDSYNSHSATINRGANAILFGLGSPAGIIENTTIQPQFVDKNRVAVSGDQYGTFRQSIDLERVIIDGKLSLRIAAVNSNQKFEQDHSFRDIRRYYGALEYRMFKNTTFRVNAETGKQTQRLPRPNPPIDGVTSWYTYGKLTRADNLYLPGAPTTARNNYERLNNLDGSPALTAGFVQPNIFYSDPTNGSESGILATMPWWASTTVTGVGTTAYRMMSVRQTTDARNWAFANPPTNGMLDPVINNIFSFNTQILDRSAFDYRKHTLYGPNDHSDLDLDSVNFSAEQLFLNGDAGVEFVSDWQKTYNWQFGNFTGTRGEVIGIDVNQQLTNGAPNPNFGRPFVTGLGSNNRVTAEKMDYRATAFYRHDFRKNFDNWMGKLLGRHTATVFYSDSSAKTFRVNAYNAVVAPTYQNASGGSNAIGNRQLESTIYIGPSLLNTTSLAGANLNGSQAEILWPTSLTSWTINNGTGNVWAQRTDTVYSGVNDDNLEWLANSVSGTRQEILSYGEVLQGYWWDGLLVSTLGWRHDQVENWTGSVATFDPVTGARLVVHPHLAPQLAKANTSFSAGYALRIPPRWTAKLPGRPELTLYYNDSENFRLTPARNTIYNEPIPPEGGSTKEWGIGLSALDGKLNFRLARYKTFQENVTDTRISANAFTHFVASMESTILANNTPEQILAVNYLGFDQLAKTSPLFQEYMRVWDFRVTGTNANGTRTVGFTAPVGVTDVTGAESRGYEFEATYNPTPRWRITANVTQQDATRGQMAPQEDALFKDRFEQYFRPEVINLLNGFYLNGVPSATNSTLTLRHQNYLNGQLTEDQPVVELVEWSANLITNYEFSKTSRLKGVSIGGAARWREGSVIGYPVKVSPDDPTLNIRDIDNAWRGDDILTFDGWVGYSRTIYRNKIKWGVRLNIRNLLNDNLLIPTGVNPVALGNTKDYTVAQAVIGAERQFSISSTFDF